MFEEFTRESEMKRSLFILFLSLIFAVSCGDGSMKITTPESEEKQDETVTDDDTNPPSDNGDTISDDGDTDPTPDEGDTVTDDNDTTPDDNGDTLPDDDGDTAQEDGDTMPDDDADTAEGPDDDSMCEPGTKQTKECSGLPQNGVWNTAEYVEQECGSEGFSPSTAGTYNEDPASSTFEDTVPSFKEPLPPDCPEGTGDVDGLCEYTGCGQYAYVMHFTNKNGVFIYKRDPTSNCFKEASTSSEQAPCCCGKPLYKFSQSGEIQETYDPASNPMEYASSFTENGGVASTDEWVCTPTIPCENDYEYGKETGKCYKCSGELYFDGSQYQCRIEIGSECRFKCKAGFKWNGEECF